VGNVVGRRFEEADHPREYDDDNGDFEYARDDNHDHES
jgi:hypothetical protein